MYQSCSDYTLREIVNYFWCLGASLLNDAETFTAPYGGRFLFWSAQPTFSLQIRLKTRHFYGIMKRCNLEGRTTQLESRISLLLKTGTADPRIFQYCESIKDEIITSENVSNSNTQMEERIYRQNEKRLPGLTIFPFWISNIEHLRKWILLT